MYIYNATIINVVDGDTFDVDVDLGFHIHIHERVRLLDIDTPEKRGQERELGEIIKQYAINNFLNKKMVIQSYKEDVSIGTDSFGRWLVKTQLEDGRSIVDIYNELGINKLHESYNEDNVRKLLD